jgi:hypothetical protein
MTGTVLLNTFFLRGKLCALSKPLDHFGQLGEVEIFA